MTGAAAATPGRPFAGIPLVGRTREQFRRMRHDRLGALRDFNREQGDILPEAEAARPKTAFIPFSAGPRTCIGNAFALMEGPLVLATLLHHADLALVDGAGALPEPHATLRPKGGLPMRVALRPRADLGCDRPTIAAARS